jgi:biopolymer transport protein ExbB
MNSLSRFRISFAVALAALTLSTAGVALAQAPAPSPEPVAAAPAAPVIVAPPATEVVSNPYGIEALWKQGDFIARGTLIILVIMSLGSWYIGIVKLIEQVRLMRDGREAREKFWKAPSAAQGAALLNEDSAYRYLSQEGIQAAEHHEGTLEEQIDLNNWVGMSLQRSIDAIAEKQENGLAFLATVGSTAPFVGLFGTVWGIYHALTAIGIAGQASIDKVAGPVGEALIMTAMGLAVAVPAVLGYNWLVRRNKSAMAGLRQFSSQLHMVLLAGGRKDGRKA